jgi:hypothetical protein
MLVIRTGQVNVKNGNAADGISKDQVEILSSEV